MTDTDKRHAEQLIAELETAVGEIAPRDGANAGLLRDMIQSLNGLRSVLGITTPKH